MKELRKTSLNGERKGQETKRRQKLDAKRGKIVRKISFSPSSSLRLALSLIRAIVPLEIDRCICCVASSRCSTFVVLLVHPSSVLSCLMMTERSQSLGGEEEGAKMKPEKKD